MRATEVDLLEQNLEACPMHLLEVLLQDKTTGENIRWATDAYSNLGKGYQADDYMVPSLIVGENTLTIQPRAFKTLEEQLRRTRNSAEVFTPLWVCCAQNEAVDQAWFGRPGAITFGANPDTSWTNREEPILFDDQHSWKDYVDKRVLEISCGEAPYLVSRYDPLTGNPLRVEQRIGLLDRKLRAVMENTLGDDAAWHKWALRAFEATYGFDYQGDNVLLARENLLATYIDYFRFRNGTEPSQSEMREVSNRVSWNLFQMDGLTFTTPHALRSACHVQLSLIEEEGEALEPVPTKVYDWRARKPVEYRRLVGGSW